MHQLQLAAKRPHLAAEQAQSADHGLPAQVAMVEERQQQVGPAIGDDELRPFGHATGALLTERCERDALDAREDRGVLVGTQRAEVGQLTPLDVAPRVVVQKLTDGLVAESLIERFGRADPHRRLQRIAHRHHGTSVALTSVTATEASPAPAAHSTPKISGHRGCPPS